MKQIITVMMLGFLSLTFGQSNLDRIEGFRNITWGSHVDSVYVNGEKINFVPATKVDLLNGGKFYTIPEDVHTIGSVRLSNIYYVFSDENDRLYKVILEGRKKNVDEMEFIVDYKYGPHLNEAVDDDKVSKQWIVADVTLSLYNFNYNKFEFVLESDWQAAEDYKKNTNVDDF